MWTYNCFSLINYLSFFWRTLVGFEFFVAINWFIRFFWDLKNDWRELKEFKKFVDENGFLEDISELFANKISQTKLIFAYDVWIFEQLKFKTTKLLKFLHIFLTLDFLKLSNSNFKLSLKNSHKKHKIKFFATQKSKIRPLCIDIIIQFLKLPVNFMIFVIIYLDLNFI